MQFITDANVLFSAIISGKSLYKHMVKTHEIFTLDYIFLELAEYQVLILEKTKLDDIQLTPYLLALFSHIKVLPSMILSEESRQHSYQLCQTVDMKDAPYIALAIQLNIPLITNDKILFEDLKKKKFRSIILFSDFVSTYL